MMRGVDKNSKLKLDKKRTQRMARKMYVLLRMTVQVHLDSLMIEPCWSSPSDRRELKAFERKV